LGCSQFIEHKYDKMLWNTIITVYNIEIVHRSGAPNIRVGVKADKSTFMQRRYTTSKGSFQFRKTYLVQESLFTLGVLSFPKISDLYIKASAFLHNHV